MIQIENDYLVATFNQIGAELISLKSKETNIEYIWQGDSAYWGRHAPVLFPIVGRLKNDEYEYQGKKYPMNQHGFARDEVFEVISHKAEEIRFRLSSSEKTKKTYPFDFILILSFELTGAGIVAKYQVENSGADVMYFSIGGHPAFNVPLVEGLTFEDYFLHFSPQKSRLSLPLEGSYINLNGKTLGQTNTDINLNHDLFENDALIYETKGVNSYSIRSEKSPHEISLTYDKMPYVGIWSTYPKKAPFVCIEPWCGIADTNTSSGLIEEKLGMNCLKPNEIFKQKYCITVK